jgi:hypothetical protein
MLELCQYSRAWSVMAQKLKTRLVIHLVNNVTSYFQWRSQTFIFGGGEANAEGARPSRVVRGHAPPGKFWNLESLKCDFKHFGGEILQNSEDYKVHRRHKFSQTFLIFYSELNKLEMSPWKTGGAGQRHLISPLWCWGKKSQCDFDQKCCI